jgi:hypothetical protein
MLGFFLDPAILWLILFFVARHGTERSYFTLFFVSVGITVVAFLSSIYIPQFAVFVIPIVSVLALRRFCNVGWGRAVVVTVLFVAWLCFSPVLFESLIK